MKNKFIKNDSLVKVLVVTVALGSALQACAGNGGGTEANNNSVNETNMVSTSSNQLASTSSATDKLNKFIYTADHSANMIHIFKLNYDNSTLRHLSDVSVDGNGVSSISVSSDKKNLYVTLDTDKKIKHFLISQDNYGTLTLQPDELDLDYKPGKLIFAGNGKAYISSSPDEASPHLMIVDYDASTGQLEQQSVSYIDDQKSGADMVLSADGHHFWEGFTNIDSNGDFVKGFYAPNEGDFVLTTPGVSLASGGATALAIQSVESNENLLVIDKTSQRLVSYRLDLSESTTGIIASTANSVPTGSGPSDVVITPNGKFAYVGNTISKTINWYILNESGVKESAVIFVTASTHDGNFSGYSGADDMCNTEAQKTDAGTTINNLYDSGIRFKALLGGNEATQSGIVYYRPDQSTIIAKANSGNLNTLLENSISGGAESLIWTAITSDGNTVNNTLYNCDLWTNNENMYSYEYKYGSIGSTAHKGSTENNYLGSGNNWTTDETWMPCDQAFRLACVEQFGGLNPETIINPGLLSLSSDGGLLFITQGGTGNVISDSLAISVYEINPTTGALKNLLSINEETLSTTTDMVVVEQPMRQLMLYTTSTTWWGNLGGISGADERCQDDSQCPVGKVCKAVISAPDRHICDGDNCGPKYSKDWPLMYYQEYVNANNEYIGETTDKAKFDSDTTSNLAKTVNVFDSGKMWTGMHHDWTQGDDCDHWTKGDGDKTEGSNLKFAYVDFDSSGDSSCYKYTNSEGCSIGVCSTRRLFCAEQP